MIAAGCALNGRNGHDAGRELLRLLYEKETGEPLPEIQVTDRGKPYFPNSTFHFSITHTDRHAFCVLSRCPVGIDAEETDRKVGAKLAAKVLSESEREQYDNSPDPRRAFLTFWVLKEAEAKCSGEGLRGYPNHTAFRLDDPRVREWENCLVAIISENTEEGVSIYAV